MKASSVAYVIALTPDNKLVRKAKVHSLDPAHIESVGKSLLGSIYRDRRRWRLSRDEALAIRIDERMVNKARIEKIEELEKFIAPLDGSCPELHFPGCGQMEEQCNELKRGLRESVEREKARQKEAA
jgi:hypothetical protein